MINFCNNGILSLLDLTTMGDSSKRDDSSKTGMFDSGLKYAIAILMRNNTPPRIKSGNYQYTFDTKLISDENGKSKEIIYVLRKNLIDETLESFDTAFALNLGFQWDTWQGVRELYSNCMDESGTVIVDDPNDNYDTIISVPENHVISEIINNWSSYFNTEEAIDIINGVKILPNITDNLVVYKNGVQIYSEPSKALFSYDVIDASIDEMRNANKTTQLIYSICDALKMTENESIINKIIENSTLGFYEHKTISGSDYYSDKWIEIVNDLHSEGKLPKLPESMKSGMIENNKFSIGIKAIPSGSSWYSPSIKVEPVENVPVEEKLTFEEEVKKICKSKKVDVNYPIVNAKNSAIVIADPKEKVLYVSDDFSEEHVWKILKEQYRIERFSEDEIYKNYVKLLNK